MWKGASKEGLPDESLYQCPSWPTTTPEILIKSNVNDTYNLIPIRKRTSPTKVSAPSKSLQHETTAQENNNSKVCEPTKKEEDNNIPDLASLNPALQEIIIKTIADYNNK